MIYLGNYGDWVDDNKLIEYMDTHEGVMSPRDQNHENDVKNVLHETSWNSYTSECTIQYNDTEYLPLELPDVKTDYYWLNKMLPGMCMPWHRDSNSDTVKVRYWMPLQDYEPGHIFICKHELMVNYKKGDLFKHEDPSQYHLAGNLGWINRYTLNLVEFK